VLVAAADARRRFRAARLFHSCEFRWSRSQPAKRGRIDVYETTPREIILYFRSLAPKAEKTVVLQLRADLPGQFTGIASSAYLYYGDDHKWWVDPVKVAIAK
jgi:hypothetical protein